jgi:CheY-like chemotaxis protein
LQILLVEDHADTSEAFARLLGMRGFRVVVAQTVAGAFELARQLPIDLLLCDLDLPDGDGCQLLHRMRGELGMDQLRSIAFSGHGAQAVADRAQAAGFDAFILKPMEMPKFYELLEQVCSAQPAPPTKREFIAIRTPHAI